MLTCLDQRWNSFAIQRTFAAGMGKLPRATRKGRDGHDESSCNVRPRDLVVEDERGRESRLPTLRECMRHLSLMKTGVRRLKSKCSGMSSPHHTISLFDQVKIWVFFGPRHRQAEGVVRRQTSINLLCWRAGPLPLLLYPFCCMRMMSTTFNGPPSRLVEPLSSIAWQCSSPERRALTCGLHVSSPLRP
jgi:hypothetical protein